MFDPLRRTIMVRFRDSISACASLLVTGLVASCATLDDAAAPAERTAEIADHATAASTAHDAIAVTDDGVVRGVANGATRAFLGIPYAAAPVGDLRWRPPQRHARWTGVRDATQLANHCPQPTGPFGRASETEDCLFLNVFTP